MVSQSVNFLTILLLKVAPSTQMLKAAYIVDSTSSKPKWGSLQHFLEATAFNVGSHVRKILCSYYKYWFYENTSLVLIISIFFMNRRRESDPQFSSASSPHFLCTVIWSTLGLLMLWI